MLVKVMRLARGSSNIAILGDFLVDTSLLLSFVLLSGLTALSSAAAQSLDILFLGAGFVSLTRSISEGTHQPSSFNDLKALTAMAFCEFLHAFGLHYILGCFHAEY